MSIKIIYALLLIGILDLRTSANSELQITRFGASERNSIMFQCREDFFNGTVVDLTDLDLFLFNSTRRHVASLLDDEGVSREFDQARGILSFLAQQDIEGYYFCSRDTSVELGLPEDRLYTTVVAQPSRREVPTSYVRHVGESVTLLSGAGEGALASHYAAEWTKDGFIPYNNISRGDDFSLNIYSVDYSDNGTYVSEVIVTTGSGETHLVPDGRPIHLIVYEGPIIEQAPEPIVVDQKESEGKGVVFTCVATGEQSLRLSWLKGDKNLTVHSPSNYAVNENRTNRGARIMSTLTINSPTYEDNGQFVCVVTVLDDENGDERFTTQASANLTVLESDFYLKTLVTEDKRLQLWVTLQVPLYYAVTALVYFTLKQNINNQQSIPSHSVLTENTVMVYQLEPHDVPDDFREDDFYIQVALQVGTTVSSMVPSDLNMADTANLNEPTRPDCDRDETYRIATITVGCVLGLGGLIVFFVALLFCAYKCYVSHQRTVRRNNMPPEERQRLEEQNMQLLEKLRNPALTPSDREDINRYIGEILETNRRLLRGDGTTSETPLN